jgi:small subunit ribosomal protein S24e
MELDIKNKRENSLLNRIEVQFIVHHPNNPTPKRANVREELSKAMKVPKDRVVVDNMKSAFGVHSTKGYAKIYKSKEAAMEIEREYLLKRNKLESKPEKKDEPVEE